MRGGNWYIGDGVCILGNWAINRIRSDVVEVRVLCWEVRVEGVNGRQRQGIRCGCGDVRLTFGVVAEGCRVQPDPRFFCGVEVLVVAVGSVRLSVALVVLLWLGGMTCGETARRAASRDLNSCKWSHVVYWHLSCSDNYSLILYLATLLH
jgi:hypothetical protein